MQPAIRLILASFMLLVGVGILDAQTPAPTPAPTPSSPAPSAAIRSNRGDPSAALVNAVENGLSISGIKDGSIQQLYTKYQETRGPVSARMGFDMGAFTRMSGGNGMAHVVQMGFVLAFMATLLWIMMKALKGEASIGDFGWAIGKTFFGVFFVFFPGALYALAVGASTIICGLLLSQPKADEAGGMNLVIVNRAVSDGFIAAAVELNGSMSSITQIKYGADQVLYIEELCKSLNTLAKSAGIDDSKLIVIPPGGFVKPTVEGAPAKTADQSATETVEIQNNIKAAQGQYKMLLDLLIPRIKSTHFKDERAQKALEKLNADILEAQAEMAAEDDPSDQADILENTFRDTYDSASKMLYYELTVPSVLGVYNRRTGDTRIDTNSLAGEKKIKVYTDASEIQRAGVLLAKPFRDKYKDDRSLSSAFVDWVQKVWLSTFIPLITIGWLTLTELVMLSLTLLMPLWIHPKTEGTVSSLFKKLWMVAFFMPCYLICVLLLDRAMEFTLTWGEDSAADTVLSIVAPGGRTIQACIFALLSPILAIPMAWQGLKSASTGGNVIGSMIKGSLTSLGTAAALAFPAIKGVSMVAGAGMGKLAAGAATAASSASGWKRKGLNAISGGLRVANSLQEGAVNIAGDTIGVDERFMHKNATAGQNIKGGFAAMRAAATGGIKAAVKGSSATAVFSSIEQASSKRERLTKQKSDDEKDSTASDDIKTQAGVGKKLQQEKAAAQASRESLPPAPRTSRTPQAVK